MTRIPCQTLQQARELALAKSGESIGLTWYVNRLASSGPMQYEVSRRPITDTSFGGGNIGFAIDNSYFE